MISAGVFYKKFFNPIERYTQPGSGGGTLNFYYDNAIAATSAGAEIELRKSMQPIFKTGFLSKLSATMNATLIKSTVDLGDVKGNEEILGITISEYGVKAKFQTDNEARNLRAVPAKPVFPADRIERGSHK